MLTSRSSSSTSTSDDKDEYNNLFFNKHLTVNIKRDHYHSSSKVMAKFPSDRHDHDHNQDYYYYRGDSSVSIPFTWESRPGTPKVVKFRESSLPPLTPPPSYCYSPVTNRPSQSQSNKNKPGFVRAIVFPKKKRLPSSLSSRSFSSSVSRDSSSFYSPAQSPPSTPSNLRGRLSKDNARVVVSHSRADEDEENDSPVSTLCFGRVSTSSRSRSGCYSSLVKVLLN